MKKFILDLIQFSFVAIPVYIILLCFWGFLLPQSLKPNLHYFPGAYGFLNTRIKEVRQSTGADILIVGSSHAYRGFDVRIFENSGYETFNLGSSSQSPIQTYVLLKRYLKTVHPRHVIFEVYPGTFCSDGVESSIDLISNDKNDLNSISMMLKTLNLKTFNTLTFAMINDLIGNSQKFEETPFTEDDSYISGGYVQRKTAYFSPTGTIEKQKWKFNEQQFEMFYKIIDFLEEEQIPTYLVFAPITNELYSSYQNTAEFEKRMIETGLPYMNFNGKINLTDTLHFYDSHHLNQDGVVLFNEALITFMQDCRYLPKK